MRRFTFVTLLTLLVSTVIVGVAIGEMMIIKLDDGQIITYDTSKIVSITYSRSVSSITGAWEGLPAKWIMKQREGSNSWTWTMTQTSPNNWNGHVRNDQSGQESDWAFTLGKSVGNRISLHRAGAGAYNGTISSDGKSITGTCDFIGGEWSVSLVQ